MDNTHRRIQALLASITLTAPDKDVSADIMPMACGVANATQDASTDKYVGAALLSAVLSCLRIG